MSISKLCYELYKVSWKDSHGITAEIEMDSIKNYYEYIIEFGYDDCTYDDYLFEFGYDCGLYACYEEFCENEYLNWNYMFGLLDNERLIEMYVNDTKGR